MRHSGQELSIEVDGSWRNLTVDPDASGFDPGFRRQMRDIYSLLQVVGIRRPRILFVEDNKYANLSL